MKKLKTILGVFIVALALIGAVSAVTMEQTGTLESELVLTSTGATPAQTFVFGMNPLADVTYSLTSRGNVPYTISVSDELDGSKSLLCQGFMQEWSGSGYVNDQCLYNAFEINDPTNGWYDTASGEFVMYTYPGADGIHHDAQDYQQYIDENDAAGTYKMILTYTIEAV